MPVYLLDNTSLMFPPVKTARKDGLLAVGGELSVERLLVAYRNGIFPWYNEDEPPMWWSPDPRFVLYPDELRVSKSMAQLIRKNVFEFRVNSSFEAVINYCGEVPRKSMDGTWISADIKGAYTQLHGLGFAYSAEAWSEGELAGGLYGILMGKVFFGESMFSRKSNASKYAFIHWVRLLQENGIQLIDCQVHTTHLESLGAKMIRRTQFIELLNRYIG